MGGELAAEQQVRVPTVFVTMRDGDALLGGLAKTNGQLTAQLSARPRPRINASSFLIWALGVFVVRCNGQPDPTRLTASEILFSLVMLHFPPNQLMELCPHALPCM
jgi:hypothetical protein